MKTPPARSPALRSRRKSWYYSRVVFKQPFGFTVGHRRNGSLGYILTTDDMRWFWDHYLPDSNLRCDPFDSPLLAEDLDGLPPALIVVSEYDPLGDEGVAYAARLWEAGVPVEVRDYYGTVHGFLGMLSVVDIADEAAQVVARAIRATVNGTSTAEAPLSA